MSLLGEVWSGDLFFFFSSSFFVPVFLSLFLFIVSDLDFFLLASVQSMEFWVFGGFLAYFSVPLISVFSVLVHGTITFTDTAAPFFFFFYFCLLHLIIVISMKESSSSSGKFLMFHFLFLPYLPSVSCHGELTKFSVGQRRMGNYISHNGEQDKQNGIKNGKYVRELQTRNILLPLPACQVSSSEIKGMGLS